jgi:hypothetical protein
MRPGLVKQREALMRLGPKRSWRGALLAVGVLLALGIGGTAIADDDDDGDDPNTSRITTTGYTGNETSRKQRNCTGDDGAQYVELRQRLVGNSDPGSDPRLAGELRVQSRSLVKVSPPGETGIGQIFGDFTLRDPSTGRTKARGEFIGTTEADTPNPPNGDPNPDNKPPEGVGRLEGVVFGLLFGRPRSTNPLNFGRLIGNITADSNVDATQVELVTGDRDFGNPVPRPGGNPIANPPGGRDDNGHPAVLQKGDCGLGFDEEFRDRFADEDDD